MRYLILLVVCVTFGTIHAQVNSKENKFKQLHEQLPSPNVYRTASGAPGPQYWQQKADYDIEVRLDEDNHILYGEETITYFNNSPDQLTYLWVQLDQNVRSKESDTYKIDQSKLKEDMTFDEFKNLTPWFDGGFKLDYVRDARDEELKYTVNKTMMRIDLPSPLYPNASVRFKIKWHYNINDRSIVGGRSGYELFADENNAIYTIAQFYPRMAVYSDYQGWQNKQFLGRGEFTLPFGDFSVKITVPADHIVAATGELQNSKEVLKEAHLNRLAEARRSESPLEIVTQDEAETSEKGRAREMKTWHYQAKNVRDFGWASSRKFIWDAKGVPLGDRTVMAMSYYPKEANPLWGQYSTAAIEQTLKTYSKYTFDYPYPVAISVNAADIGMEYPMICFNFGRTEHDGTYSVRMKYGVISVIIHEVGHNWFPMIVNSDERQWTWMDEGLNTFLQYLTEQEFERGYPSRRGEPRNIVDYMKGDKTTISPIMTNSELIFQFGNNAYGKPATALNILRETVMGRELFDFAFKTYANRWKFKHPSPADFFRTMEDASAVDLDWFWRGWFYSTDHVDISIDYVKYARLVTPGAGGEKAAAKEKEEAPSISDIRNQASISQTAVERDTSLRDFYNDYDPNKVTELDREVYERYVQTLTEEEKTMLEDERHFYEIAFTNHGGLVMPLIVGFTFENGEMVVEQIPAEIWKMGDDTVTKVFAFDRKAVKIELDPYQQTADVNLDNNSWPAEDVPTRFELFKRQARVDQPNPMQEVR